MRLQNPVMLRNSVSFLFLFLFLISFPGLAEVGSQTQDTIEGKKNTSTYWFSIIRTQPNSLAYFNLGVTLYQESRLETALKAFRKVIQSKSQLSPVARYYSALILKKLNRVAEAKSLIKTISLNELPPHIKAEILIFKNELFADEAIDEINEEDEANAKSEVIFFGASYGSIELNYGSNSNPNISPSSVVTANQADKQTQSKLKLGTDLIQLYSWNLGLEYNFAGTYYQKTATANYDSHDLIAPLLFRGHWLNFRIYPEFYLDNYSNSRYSQQSGGNVELSFPLESWTWGLGHQQQTIQNLTTTYSYLSGSMAKNYAFLDLKLQNSRIYSSLSLSQYSYVDTSSLASSYTLLNLYMNYTYYLSDFEFNLGASLDSKNYSQAALDSIARQDFRTFFDFGISYYSSKNFKFYLDYNQSVNQSNFTDSTTDYDYTQKVLIGGVKYLW